MPFATGWMGVNHFAQVPTAVYGMDLVMCAVACTILQAAIIAHQGQGSRLAEAVKWDIKGKMSMVMYVAAIPLAFVNALIANAIFVAVALMWLLTSMLAESTTRFVTPICVNAR